MILSGCLVYKEKSVLLLYKKKWHHWETPGGKVEDGETLKDAALRELSEEVENFEYEFEGFFSNVKFEIPDGTLAEANKFLLKYISGEIKVKEKEKFEKAEWISVKDIDNFPISPDLKLITEKLKERFL